MLIVVIFWKQVSIDKFIGQNGIDNQYIQHYNLLLHLFIPLVILNGLCQGMFAFAVYATLNDGEYLRQIIYIFNMMFLVSCIFGIYYIPQLGIEVGLCVVLPLTTLVLLLNWYKHNNLYFLGGSVVLLFLFLLSWGQFIQFREGAALRDNNLQDCDNQMKQLPSEWFTSCSKYLSSYQTCDQSGLVYSWDL